MQETERLKQAKNKKVQQNVDKAREQNAQRKMDKVQMREWDSGKPANEGKKHTFPATSQDPPAEHGGSHGPASRGGGRGRGRGGRARGRGIRESAANRDETVKDASTLEPKAMPAEEQPEVAKPDEDKAESAGVSVE